VRLFILNGLNGIMENSVNKYETFGVFSPDEVLPYAIPPHERRTGLRRVYKGSDGAIWSVKMSSHRYWVFRKSLSCVACGRVGNIMVLQRDRNQSCQPHFNLYSVEEDGTWILMTKDHIVPVSKGGANHISNYQTMCCECNELKGNSHEQS